MIAGRSASASSFAASSTPSAAWNGSRRRIGHLGLRLHEDDVHRVVDEGRARRAGSSAVSIASAVVAGDLRRVLDRQRRLHQRLDEGQVVDLLERARSPAHLRGAAAERHQRHPVGLGGGDRAHPVGHPAAGGERADAGLAGRLRPADRGEDGRLLVAEVDHLDPLRLAAVVDREEVAAGEGEELRHPAALQRPGDQPAAVDCAAGIGLGRDLLLLRRHRREPSALDRLEVAAGGAEIVLGVAESLLLFLERPRGRGRPRPEPDRRASRPPPPCPRPPSVAGPPAGGRGARRPRPWRAFPSGTARARPRR